MFYLQLPYHLLGSSFFFAQRIPLDFLEGDEFREAADNYVRPLLTKTFASVVMQHYDRRGQYSLALAKIDEAIEHTPTVIDLYSIKEGGDFFLGERVMLNYLDLTVPCLENAGDLPAAAALADEARSMDLADRYLNTECVMRMLQADQVSYFLT
ncbi:hypothetical protein B296_00044213 [Ensete ventricosum]|uniref:Uncharacterized protein n=1 Tax=Ensete ventricosum TaxID=4639 RepID=A0A426YZU1_ENSVE|nr:hypothetical protein B296_00044213 [Ensete ventricosum]